MYTTRIQYPRIPSHPHPHPIPIHTTTPIPHPHPHNHTTARPTTPHQAGRHTHIPRDKKVASLLTFLHLSLVPCLACHEANTRRGVSAYLLSFLTLLTFTFPIFAYCPIQQASHRRWEGTEAGTEAGRRVPAGGRKKARAPKRRGVKNKACMYACTVRVCT